MTSQTKLVLESEPEASRVVAEYLVEHPEIFTRHPQLLAELEIAHDSGDAVSLVERQVSILREDNKALKAHFDNLVSIATQNEDLGRRLHTLSLALIEAPGIISIIEVLKIRLKADFGADSVALRVFAEPAFVADVLPEFIGKKAPEKNSYQELLAGTVPICGGLSDEQRDSLFDPEQIVGSAVQLPLIGRGWQAVMVAISEDSERYSADMGTELLSHLADVTTLALAPWVVVEN